MKCTRVWLNQARDFSPQLQLKTDTITVDEVEQALKKIKSINVVGQVGPGKKRFELTVKGKIQIMISKMLILFEVLKDKNTVLEAMIFNKIL